MGEGLYRHRDGLTVYCEPFDGIDPSDEQGTRDAWYDLGDALAACVSDRWERAPRRWTRTGERIALLGGLHMVWLHENGYGRVHVTFGVRPDLTRHQFPGAGAPAGSGPGVLRPPRPIPRPARAHDRVDECEAHRPRGRGMKTSKVALIRIPRVFYDDHLARDLPSPVVHQAQRYHYTIRADDPALDELESDARHYAEGGISTRDFPELFGLVASARATLHAIRTHRESSSP